MVILIISLICSVASLSAGSCDYKGNIYKAGDTWVKEDRCNTCTCQNSGLVSCETKNCTAVFCHDNGRNYNLGETYLSSDGCNQCICSVNGALCTLMACTRGGAGVEYFDIPRCHYHQHVYTVGDAFQAIDGCNRCICTEKQMVICTKMFCQPSTITPPETTKAPKCIYNGRVHSLGDVFKSKDGCNTCNCVANDQIACTDMECLIPTTPPTSFGPTYELTTKRSTCLYNGRIYDAGNSFRADDGCNTCTCGGNDHVICTLMLCPKTTASLIKSLSTVPMVKSTNSQTCIYNGRSYKLGAVFQADDGCNTCTCAGNGIAACTLMMCPPTTAPQLTSTQLAKASTSSMQCKYKGHIYKVGVVFQADDGCNKCTCAGNGIAACTLMLCPPTTAPPVTTTEQTIGPTITIQCNYNGQHYSFGQSFKHIDGCNTCRCMYDGIACTKMYCQSSTELPTISTKATTTISAKCDYNGHIYSLGDGFKAIDGCNDCKCIGEQQVACTKKHCPSTSTPFTTNLSSKTTVNHLKMTLNR